MFLYPSFLFLLWTSCNSWYSSIPFHKLWCQPNPIYQKLQGHLKVWDSFYDFQVQFKTHKRIKSVWFRSPLDGLTIWRGWKYGSYKGFNPMGISQLGSLSLLSHFLGFNFVDISVIKETWLDKGVEEKNWNLFFPMTYSLKPISGKIFYVIGFQSMLNSPEIFVWHENFNFNEELVSKQSI